MGLYKKVLDAMTQVHGDEADVELINNSLDNAKILEELFFSYAAVDSADNSSLTEESRGYAKAIFPKDFNEVKEPSVLVRFVSPSEEIHQLCFTAPDDATAQYAADCIKLLLIMMETDRLIRLDDENITP